MLPTSIESQDTRIVPVSRPNQVKEFTKNADGSMTCIQASGNQFTIPANEKEMQAFVVFTMLDSEARA